MAIATVQLPDGRLADFEVPDDASDEQALAMANAYLAANPIPEETLAEKNSAMLSQQLQQDVQKHPEPQQPEKPRFSNEPATTFDSGVNTAPQRGMGAAPAPKQRPQLTTDVGKLLMEQEDVPVEQPYEREVQQPITPEFRQQVENAWDAAIPEQRAQMEQVSGTVGALAAERRKQFEQQDTTGVKAGEVFDTRAEKRAEQLVGEGIAPDYAQNLARRGAKYGTTPGGELEAEGVTGTIGPSDFDWETRDFFKDTANAPGYVNIGRGISKGALGLGQAGLGLLRYTADITGAENAAALYEQGSRSLGRKEEAIGEAATPTSRIVENSISSISQQLPFLIGTVATGGTSTLIPLAGIAATTFGQEYNTGRATGQTAEQASDRAALFAALEVIGEKFGLAEQLAALRGASQGMSNSQIIKFFKEALIKEVPGELLTSTGQFAVDKFAPAGRALNPGATLEDYINTVKDTIASTLVQSGLMTAGTTATSAIIRASKTGRPEQGARVEPTYTPEEPRQLRGPTDESARTDTGAQPPGVDNTGARASLPILSEQGAAEGSAGEAEVTTRGGMGVSGGSAGPVGGAKGRVEPALDITSDELKMSQRKQIARDMIVAAAAEDETLSSGLTPKTIDTAASRIAQVAANDGVALDPKIVLGDVLAGRPTNPTTAVKVEAQPEEFQLTPPASEERDHIVRDIRDTGSANVWFDEFPEQSQKELLSKYNVTDTGKKYVNGYKKYVLTQKEAPTKEQMGAWENFIKDMYRGDPTNVKNAIDSLHRAYETKPTEVKESVVKEEPVKEEPVKDEEDIAETVKIVSQNLEIDLKRNGVTYRTFDDDFYSPEVMKALSENYNIDKDEGERYRITRKAEKAELPKDIAKHAAAALTAMSDSTTKTAAVDKLVQATGITKTKANQVLNGLIAQGMIVKEGKGYRLSDTGHSYISGADTEKFVEPETTKAITKEPPKITQPTVPGQFQLGDLVRYGNESGTVIGVDGNYVKMQPAGAKNAKAYRKIPVNKLEFVSRPDLSLSSSASKKEELGQEAGQLKMDTEEMVERFGRGMYGAATAEMIAKELLQNSFDAVKGAASTVDSKGNKITPKYKVGNIELILDRKNRTITIKDDGVGMTPAIVRDALFTVAGSEKSNLPPEERSGGLGLAKLGALTGATRYVVDTVRDGIRTQVDASTKDIIRSNFTINKIAAEEGEHGTTITAYIPETYTKPQTGEELSIYFPDETPDALKKPLIGPANIIVKYRSGWGGDKFETYNPGVGANFPYDDYQKFDVDKIFNHSRAEVYVGKERTKYPKHRVLSSGVYQFDTRFMLSQSEQIPYDIIVNIKSKVPASSEDYPFTNTREAFKPRFEEDVSALSQYLASYARGEEARDLAETFQDLVALPRTEVGEEVADTSNKLKKAFEKKGVSQESHKLPPMPTNVTIGGGQVLDKLNRVLLDTDKEREKKQKAEKVEKKSFTEGKDKPKKATDYMMEMTHDPSQPIFHNNTSVDYIEIGRQYGDPEKFFAELATLVLEMKEALADSGMYGYDKISNKNLYFAGIAIDKKYGGLFTIVPLKSILINPFYDWGATTLSGVRRNIVTTIVHEIAHTNDMSHGVGHNNQMMRVEQHLEDVGLWDYLNDAVSDILTRHESTFTAMRDAYGRSTTKNIAKSFEDYEGNTPARTPRRGATGASNKPGAVPTGGGQGGSGTVPPTSGARNAGRIGRRTGKSTKQVKLTRLEKRLADAKTYKDYLKSTGQLWFEANTWAERKVILDSLAKRGDVVTLRAYLPFLPTDAISEWVHKDIPQIANVNRLELNRESYRWKRIQNALDVTDKLVDFYNKYKEPALDQLSNTTSAATFHEVDPSAYQNLSDALNREPELLKLKDKFTKATPDKKRYALGKITKRENEIREVFGEWHKLGLYGSGEGHKMYKLLLDGFAEIPDEYGKILIELAENSGLSGDINDKTSDKGRLRVALEKRYLESKQIPVYFPLGRQGSFWLRLGKGDSHITPTFETALQRDVALADWLEKKKTEGDTRTQTELMREGELDFGDDLRGLRKQINPSSTTGKLLKDIFDLVDKAGTPKGPGTVGSPIDTEGLMDSIFEMIVLTLPGRDLRAQYVKRKKTSGWGMDIINDYVKLQTRAANQLARLKYEGPMRNELGAAYDHVKSDPKKEWLNSFIKEIELRINAELGPSRRNEGEVDWDKWAARGKSVVFYWLLSAPKTAIVQMTQLPIVAYPKLIDKYGAADASAVTLKYMNWYNKLGITEVDENGNVTDKAAKLSVRNSKYLRDNKLLQSAYDWADTQLNFFSNTNAASLTSRTDKRTSVIESRFNQGTRLAVNFMTGALHNTERLSRELMYMASFELALKKHLGGRTYTEAELKDALNQLKQIENAFDLEADVTKRKAQSPLAKAIEKARREAAYVAWDAMYNYSTYNKPRVMTSMGALPALATNLDMFPISTTVRLVKNFWRILPTVKDQYKLEYKKAKEEGLNDTDAEARARTRAKDNEDRIRKLRRSALIMFLGMQGMMFLFSGLTGLWGVSSLFGLIEGMRDKYRDIHGHDPLEDLDYGNPLAQKDLYLWFTDYFLPHLIGSEEDPWAQEGWRKTLKQSLVMGPASAITGYNIGSSTGFDNMFFSHEPDADKTRAAFAQFMYDHMFGASGQVAGQAMDAADQVRKGEWEKGIEKLLPGFLKGPVAAVRQGTQGEVTNGAMVRPPEWFSFGKLLGRSIGFEQTDLAEIRRQTIASYKIWKEGVKTRNEILDTINQANEELAANVGKSGFDKAMKDYVKAMKKQEEFNQTSFGAVDPLTPDSISTSIQERATRVDKAIEGRSINDKYQQDFGRTPATGRFTTK